MAEYIIQGETLTAIADAVRGKTGSTDAMSPMQMATAIDGISTGSEEEWIGDGNTHLWISLQEGRTSPMLGVCPKGTVTVDWGDGTEPDVLTGTSEYISGVKWTPRHEYASPGDYIITLTVNNGYIGLSGRTTTQEGAYILRYSDTDDVRNIFYRKSLRKVELGNSVKFTGSSFYGCDSMETIKIPEDATNIGEYAFQECYGLKTINFPDNISQISHYAFHGCKSLENIKLPSSINKINNYSFCRCEKLTAVYLPGGTLSIGQNAFANALGMKFYDFTTHTAVPTLTNTNAFTGIPEDCEIRVPAALAEEWKAATNWSTYADHIVGV